MTQRLSKQQLERVNKIVADAMQAPADDELVAAVYQAYQEAVASGELEPDTQFESEARAHLQGTQYELQGRD